MTDRVGWDQRSAGPPERLSRSLGLVGRRSLGELVPPDRYLGHVDLQNALSLHRTLNDDQLQKHFQPKAARPADTQGRPHDPESHWAT